MPSSIASSSSFFSRLSSRGSVLKDYKCTVQFLEDTDTQEFEFKKSDTGQLLLDQACKHLDIVEKDYFGLRFMDVNRQRYWLDPSKPIMRQIKGSTPIVFRFRVRYYPSDPAVLKEEITRYQLFLQLRRDLLHGRLYCPQSDAAFLGACIIQSELGDYEPDEHQSGYTSEYKLFLKQTAKLEDRIAQAHQTETRGMTPDVAELEFLKRASKLDTYGFDPHTVKEAKLGAVYVGITHQGVLVFQGNRKIHHVRWNDVEKLDYVGKEFRVYPRLSYFDSSAPVSDFDQTPPNEEANNEEKMETSQNGETQENQDGTTKLESTEDKNESAKSKTLGSSGGKGKRRQAHEVLRYHCPSATYAKHMWRGALAQQTFFNDRAQDEHSRLFHSKPRIPVFTRGSSFRYSGRVLSELEAPTALPKREDGGQAPAFVRYHVERQPNRDERTYPWMMNKYATMPNSARHRSKDDENDAAMTERDLLRRSVEAPDGATRMERTVTPPIDISLNNDVGSGAGTASPVVNLSPTGDEPKHLVENGTVTVNESQTSSVLENISQYDSKVFDTTMASFSASRQQPLQSSTPKKLVSFDSTTNGGTRIAPTKQNGDVGTASASATTTTTTERGACSRATRHLLTGLLFTIILVSVMVAVMEVKDRSFRRYVHNVPGAEAFRHQYYEPSRAYLLDTVDKARNGAQKKTANWW